MAPKKVCGDEDELVRITILIPHKHLSALDAMGISRQKVCREAVAVAIGMKEHEKENIRNRNAEINIEIQNLQIERDAGNTRLAALVDFEEEEKEAEERMISALESGKRLFSVGEHRHKKPTKLNLDYLVECAKHAGAKYTTTNDFIKFSNTVSNPATEEEIENFYETVVFRNGGD